MSGFYDEDEEDISLRVRHSRSPHRVYERPPARPYYSSNSVPYLEVAGGMVQRSRSRSRPRAPPAPAPAPVIINNRIDNYYDDEDDQRYALAPPAHVRSHSHSRPSSFLKEDYELELARKDLEMLKLRNLREEEELRRSHSRNVSHSHSRSRARSRSRSHSRSRSPSQAYSKKDYELENARRELDTIKARAQREEDDRVARQKRELKEYKDKIAREEEEKMAKQKRELREYKDKVAREEEEARIKREIEIKQLEKERKETAEKKAREEAKRAAVEEYKIKEAQRAAKEKKEKAEREKEYQRRLEEDLRQSGMDERQIQAIKNKEKPVDRPTYTKMARRHLSIETLNAYRIDYEYDEDPDYVLIKRWVPEYEQDILWTHTREIRERRTSSLLIEGRPKHKDVEFEFVREKKHKRKPSPALVGFFAGGQRR